MTTPGMSSTPSISLISRSWSSARQGAKPDVVAISAADDVWSAAVGGALRSLSRRPLVRWTSGGLICALGLWRLAQVL